VEKTIRKYTCQKEMKASHELSFEVVEEINNFPLDR
jgi:hypothetical protein